MTRDELKNLLLNYLDGAKEASAGRQIRAICHQPGCDDKSGHLYIGRFDSDEAPLFYDCKKCHQSGRLTSSFIEEYYCINIDRDLAKDIDNSNKGTSNYRMYDRQNRIYKNRFTNPIASNTPVTQTKQKFINDRLGLNLSLADMANLKIILNLGEYLDLNHIHSYTRDIRIVQQLNNYFVGFVSFRNYTVNMRNLIYEKKLNRLNESIDKKYINYNLKDNVPTDYYILPTTIDANRPLNIYIAEGAFDILGVYFNTNCNKDNAIFIAGKGKAYLESLEFIITNFGLGIGHLNYYVDRDVRQDKIIEIVEYLKPFNLSIDIHRNMFGDEKDYGVPKERIIDTIVSITTF